MSIKPKPDDDGFVVLGSILGIQFKGRRNRMYADPQCGYELHARTVVNGVAYEYHEYIPAQINISFAQMIRMLARKISDHVVEEHMDTEGKGIVYELDRL